MKVKKLKVGDLIKFSTYGGTAYHGDPDGCYFEKLSHYHIKKNSLDPKSCFAFLISIKSFEEGLNFKKGLNFDVILKFLILSENKIAIRGGNLNSENNIDNLFFEKIS